MFLIFGQLSAFGQVVTDSLTQADSTLLIVDSTLILTDSLVADTTISGQINISKQGFDDPVKYEARDSMYFDMVNKALHLYGTASIEYTSIRLEAHHIVYYWESGLMEAFHFRDSSGAKIGQPNFSDGSQSFISDRMKYNFKTNKGIVYDVVTKEKDVFIRGAKTKFSRTNEGEETQDVIFSQNALFTSCDHEIPHYGIRSKKQKIIPNKEVIIGPSVLELGGVPTPLVLPFGFFPITESRSAGLLIPTDYTYNNNWGFGLEEIGFYYPFNDYADAQIMTKFYFNGTWGALGNFRYKKRYKHDGALTVEYNDVRSERSGTTQIIKDRTYSFVWRHNQAAKAHPNITMGGEIRLAGNQNDQLTQFDYRSQTQNTISSNFRFSKRFPYSPFSMNVNISNNQNVRTRELQLTLPSLRLNMNKIFPFENKERVGKAKWYEDIYLSYDLAASNSIITTDTTLLERETLDNMTYGVSHNASTGKSIRLFKYFSLNPSIDYNEVWNFQGVRKDVEETIATKQDTVFEDDIIISIKEVQDTTIKITDERVQEFNSFRNLSFNSSLDTKVFGTWLMEKGWLRGLRHTFSPRINFSYTPTLGNFEEKYIKQYTTSKETSSYNITDNFAYQGVNVRERMTLSYGISDIFEGKYFSKKDSLVKKFSILKRVSFSGNYDFLADSLKFSDPAFSIQTPVTTLTDASFSWSWSYYDLDDEGIKIDRFYFKDKGRLFRSLGGNLRLTTGFNLPQIGAIIRGEKQQNKPEEEIQTRPNDLVELLNSLSFRHNFTFNFEQRSDGVVGSVSSHTFNVNGNIPLTEKWRINVGNVGWDFLREQITYPDIGFGRDLHCWEMNLNWQPQAGAYRFTIRVKPGSLGFLELPYNRNPYENF